MCGGWGHVYAAPSLRQWHSFIKQKRARPEIFWGAVSPLSSPLATPLIRFRVIDILYFLPLQTLYQQQTKLFNQQHAVQTQRLKRVVQLHEDYTKNLLNLKKNHDERKHTVHDQLRKEISALQKKILSDTVRKDEIF